MSKDGRIEYLEEERRKIWSRLTELEELLRKKTSDFEEEAKMSAQQATQSANISEQTKKAIIQYSEEAETKLTEVRDKYLSFEQMFQSINEISVSTKLSSDSIKLFYNDIETKAKTILEHSAEIQKIIDGKPILDEKLARLLEVFSKGDDYDSKLGVVYKAITDRKKEIDELYYQIIGYTDKSESGEDIRIKGLKDQLQESYATLEYSITESSKELASLKQNISEEHANALKQNQEQFANSFVKWTDSHTGMLKKLEDLLPNALTAGLSFAYSEKKEAEEKDNQNYLSTFNKAILGLVAISLIPFALSMVFIVQGESLHAVILRVPRIVLAILPLYLPVLWVAYSTNRKMNLAKRLIEEYSHKEVLSKTFEGLSKQIDNITDKDISADLRIRLLYNILEVNSENPGKLISDYNKSDHPLMDALEKSSKLNSAIDRLSKIPGVKKLAAVLEKRSTKILKEESEKIAEGLTNVNGG